MYLSLSLICPRSKGERGQAREEGKSADDARKGERNGWDKKGKVNDWLVGKREMLERRS